MKRTTLSIAKKLNKKELKTIHGGLGSYPCAPNGYCKYYGPGCREQQCQLPGEPLEPIDPDPNVPIVLP